MKITGYGLNIKLPFSVQMAARAGMGAGTIAVSALVSQFFLGGVSLGEVIFTTAVLMPVYLWVLPSKWLPWVLDEDDGDDENKPEAR